MVLANLAGDLLEEVTAAAERGIHRIRHTHYLSYSFLRHCGLSLVIHVARTSEPLLSVTGPTCTIWGRDLGISLGSGC